MSKIAEHIVTRLKEYNPYYIYAEQVSLPYCVYEITSETPIRSKHGIIGYTADASVYVAAATETEVTAIKFGVVTQLSKREPRYTVLITGEEATFAEEQWLWKIDIRITQHF